METDTLKAGIEKRFRKLHKISKCFDNVCEMEDIHRYRVEVKKLRALLRLINSNGNFHIKLSNQLKKAYHAFGNMRTLQIQLQRVIDIATELNRPLPQTYMQLLRIDLQAKKEIARDLVRNTHLRKDLNNIQSAIRTATNVMPSKFILDRADQLQRIFDGACGTDESLHLLRKILKDILYTWPYITKNELIDLPVQLQDKETAKDWAMVLGEYHDLCIAISLTGKDYLDRIPGGQERVFLLDIQQYWRNNKDAMQQQFRWWFEKFSPTRILT